MGRARALYQSMKGRGLSNLFPPSSIHGGRVQILYLRHTESLLVSIPVLHDSIIGSVCKTVHHLSQSPSLPRRPEVYETTMPCLVTGLSKEAVFITNFNAVVYSNDDTVTKSLCLNN
jgi:hypothetical protein